MDLPKTKNDTLVATFIAHGFGIDGNDILYPLDSSLQSITAVFDKIGREFEELSEQNKKTFLFVYCTGYGLVSNLQ